MADGKGENHLETQISKAMRSRVADFRHKADSLTLEGVRRVIEEDLGMKKYELDVHKKFIKQCLEKYFYDSAELNEPKPSEMTVEGTPDVGAVKEVQRESLRPKREDTNHTSESDEKMPNPPVPQKEDAEQNAEDAKPVEDGDTVNENTIMKEIKKRARYFRENSGSVTMSEVRRLLEEDLKLQPKSLDVHKAFIRKELEEILSNEAAEPRNRVTKTKKKKAVPIAKKGKINKAVSTSGSDESDEDLSHQSDVHSGSEEDDAEIKKKRKRNVKESKPKKTEVVKKQKQSIKEKRPATAIKKKAVVPDIEKNGETIDEENASEDDHSHSSVGEEPEKKRSNQKISYGKQVEVLKSIIKSCGMGIPPSVYRRAKQAPEEDREAFLVKELEGILEKEGLSNNPSEKEIKAVKKQKERAKELEGIDMSNIVSSSRRRTTSSFIPPKPQPKFYSESESEEEKEEGNTDEEKSSGGAPSGESEEDAEGSD